MQQNARHNARARLELLKYTDGSSEDGHWIGSAIKFVQKVLKKCNECRRKTEVYQHFLEVCNDIENLPVGAAQAMRAPNAPLRRRW